MTWGGGGGVGKNTSLSIFVHFKNTYFLKGNISPHISETEALMDPGVADFDSWTLFTPCDVIWEKSIFGSVFGQNG